MITSNNEIPFMLDSQCDRIRVADVARKISKDELAQPAEAGKCRFCNRMLPNTHIKITIGNFGTYDYPVLQCGKVASLYDEACRLADRWRMEMMERLNAKKNETKTRTYEL